jgi:hypothetical protein
MISSPLGADPRAFRHAAKVGNSLICRENTGNLVSFSHRNYGLTDLNPNRSQVYRPIPQAAEQGIFKAHRFENERLDIRRVALVVRGWNQNGAATRDQKIPHRLPRRGKQLACQSNR